MFNISSQIFSCTRPPAKAARSSALGQPMQPGPAGDLRPHFEVSHNADANCEGMQSAQVPTAKEQAPNSKGMRDGTIDAQFRHIPSHFSDLISQEPLAFVAHSDA